MLNAWDRHVICHFTNHGRVLIDHLMTMLESVVGLKMLEVVDNWLIVNLSLLVLICWWSSRWVSTHLTRILLNWVSHWWLSYLVDRDLFNYTHRRGRRLIYTCSSNSRSPLLRRIVSYITRTAGLVNMISKNIIGEETCIRNGRISYRTLHLWSARWCLSIIEENNLVLGIYPWLSYRLHLLRIACVKVICSE